jgi:hypothetical protein
MCILSLNLFIFIMVSTLVICDKNSKCSSLKAKNSVLSWSILSVIYVSTCGRSGCDRMVVRFTTTHAISAYHYWYCEFESRSGQCVQHYVKKFVSDLWQVGGFIWVLRFPPPIKLTAAIRLYFTVFLLARSNTRDIPFSNILISKKQFLCYKKAYCTLVQNQWMKLRGTRVQYATWTWSIWGFMEHKTSYWSRSTAVIV